MTRPVIEAMWPYITEEFANASSSHEAGKRSAAALDWARASIAELTGRTPGQVVFTGGGSQSDNLAIKGAALARPRGRHIVTSPIEHEAVLESCRFLQRVHGFAVDFVDVDDTGRVELESLQRLLRSDTTLCSIQHANSEVGTVQDIQAIDEICVAQKVPLHTDAVQTSGTLPTPAAALVSLSAHKFGGPKGMGVLLVDRALPLEPLVHGGGHEHGLHSGTSNVAGAVGAAVALQLASESRSTETTRLRKLRDRLISATTEQIPIALLTGSRDHRLDFHASFCFPGVNGETLLLELEQRGIMCSSGSACAAGSDEASYVLLALGIAPDIARTAVRFTLGSSTTDADISAAADAIPKALSALGAPVRLK